MAFGGRRPQGYFGSSLWLLIALSVFAYGLGIAATYYFTVRVLEVHTQQVNWDLAAEIAARLPPIESGNAPPPSLLADLAAIHPGAQLYLLDEGGNVFYPPTTRRTALKMDPILAGMQDELPKLPLWGDDPEDEIRRALFSAAPIVHGSRPGYVYVTVTTTALATVAPFPGMCGLLLGIALLLFPGLVLFCLFSLTFHRFMNVKFGHVTALLNSSIDEISAEDAWPRGKDEISSLCRDIGSVARGLQTQTKQIARLRSQRQEVVLGIVHDLRGPVAGLLAAVELMRKDWTAMTPATYASLCSAMKAGVATQNRYLSHLSEARMLDLNRGQLNLEAVDITQLAADLVARSIPPAIAKGISLTMTSQGETQLLRGDPSLLERTFANLLNNAIHYTSSGGTISLHLEWTPIAVQVRLSDTGSGIDEEDLPLIFEAFFRGQGEHTANEGGAGLGLALVRKVVRLHGGEVTVASKKGSGTCFSFDLRSASEISPEGERTSVAPKTPAGARQLSDLCWFHLLSATVLLLGVLTRPPRFIFPALLLAAIAGISIAWREPSALRVRAKSIVLGILWLFALWRTPGWVGASVVFVPFNLLFGVLLMSELRRHGDKKGGTVLCILGTIGIVICLIESYVPILAAIAFISGFVLSFIINLRFHRDRAFALIFRAIGVGSAFGMLMLGLETYLIDEEWKDLTLQTSPSVSQQTAVRIAALPGLHQTFTEISNSPAFLAAFSALSALNPSLLLALTDQHTGFLVARDESRPLKGNETVVRLRSAQEGGAPLATAISASTLAKRLLQKSSQPYLIALGLLLVCFGLTFIAAFFVLVGFPLQHATATLRSTIRALQSENALVASPRQDAKRIPILAALSAFALRVAYGRDALLAEDSRMTSLLISAVHDLSRALDAISSLVESCASTADHPLSGSLPANVVSLNTCLQSERRSIDLLFALAQRKKGQAPEGVVTLNLEEVVDEAKIDMIAAAQQNRNTILSEVDSSIQVRSNRAHLTTVLTALLQHVIERAEEGGEVRIAATLDHAEHLVKITVFCISAQASHGLGGKPDLRPGQSLCVLGAGELLAGMAGKLWPEENGGEGGKCSVTFSLPQVSSQNLSSPEGMNPPHMLHSQQTDL